ncbi:hypothetical protein NKI46_02795 [Mesorhizobium sp. M0615]|uniref:hypothetical protein n=1 Tax=Mesorhizobium sp. M0615 TaxID=2956971 RepID=UPI003336CA49
MQNVIQFPYVASPTQPVAHYIRLGESGYQKLANLHAAGRLPATRVVVDASRLKHQKELVASLKAKGAEVVLDTKVAELSGVERFEGYARHAPWAELGGGKPLTPNHFDPVAAHDIFGMIARFAGEHGVDAVLAPTHFVGDPTYTGWFKVDQASCRALRGALDREGGAHIAIDYPLIAPHTSLNDDALRSEFLAGLGDLPYDNLWVRASGFGNDAGPLTTKRFLVAMAGLHNLGKPIIADYLGGLVGQASLAFGVVSGISHGVGEKERFDAHSWHKPAAKNDNGSFGRATRIFVAGIDRSVTINELELMANAKGGRRLVTCCDRACCAHGLKDTINDPRQHAAYQNFKMIAELAAVPDQNREQHFLNGRTSEVARQAWQVKNLRFDIDDAAARKIDVAQFTKRLVDHSKQMGKMLQSLEDLHESRGRGAPRARPIAMRHANQGKGKAGSQ